MEKLRVPSALPRSWESLLYSHPPLNTASLNLWACLCQVWRPWCQWVVSLWTCRMLSPVSLRWSLFPLLWESWEQQSMLASQSLQFRTFFLLHLIGISSCEYSMLFISVTESLVCVWFCSWTAESNNLMLSLFEVSIVSSRDRVKKHRGSFSWWWLAVVLGHL